MAKHPPGRRPDTVFSEELLVAVLDKIAAGNSLNSLCKAPGMPTRKTFLEWVAKDPIIADRYTMALQARADLMAEELLEIADAPVGTTDSGSTDSGAVAKQKLQVDTRKWLMSKMLPRKYGEKIENTVVGPNGGPVQHTQIVINGK